MNLEGKPKRGRWLKRCAVFAVSCIAGAVLGVYLARTDIASYFAVNSLAKSGLVEADFEWTQLDVDASSLSNVRIRSDSFSATIKRIDLSYDLFEVWERRQLGDLHIEGLELTYDLTGPSTVDLGEVDAMVKEGLPFPLQSLSLSNARIRLLMDTGEKSFNLDAQLHQNASSGIEGQLKAKTETESLDLVVSIADRIKLSSTAHTVDLGQTLAAHGLDWKAVVPLSRDAVGLSDAEIKSDVVLHGITLESAQVVATLGPIKVQDPTITVQTGATVLTLELSGTELAHAHSTIELRRLSLDPLQVSESLIEISTTDGTAIEISIPETRWKTTSGEQGAISSQIIARLNSEYALEGYAGNLFSHELTSDSLGLSPFEISFDGTLDSLSLASERLSSPSLPWLALEAPSALVAGLDTDHPSIEFSTLIRANPASAADAPPPIEGNWRLDASLTSGTDQHKVRFGLVPFEGQPILSTPHARLLGQGSLQAEFDYWPESSEGALKVDFSGTSLETDYGDWLLQGGVLSGTLTTQPLKLQALVDQRQDLTAAASQLLPLSQVELNLQGSEIKGPADLSVQWFSGSLKSLDPSDDTPLKFAASLGAGIVRAGGESVSQFALESTFAGSLAQINADTHATLLFENEPVSISLGQTLDRSGPLLDVRGTYQIDGIHLLSSDILARHLPELDGSALTAKIRLGGETWLSNQKWDVSARIQISDGSFQMPSQEVAVDVVSADISFPSLARQSTEPAQRLTAGKIQFGDIEATDFETALTLTEGNQLAVDKAKLSLFQGTVSVDPFSLSLDSPDAALLVHFERISISPAIAMLDFFDGSVTGRLNGSLPIDLKDGYPVLGEGYLELDPNEEARFSYNADGFFTGEDGQQEEKATLGDKVLTRLGLEPNALLEDALGNLSIQRMRLDLFNRDLPQTPMRIQLAGIADTGKAKIPLNITTNVNGTVAELLNFLTRLDSLGLVSEQSARPAAMSSP